MSNLANKKDNRVLIEQPKSSRIMLRFVNHLSLCLLFKNSPMVNHFRICQYLSSSRATWSLWRVRRGPSGREWPPTWRSSCQMPSWTARNGPRHSVAYGSTSTQIYFVWCGREAEVSFSIGVAPHPFISLQPPLLPGRLAAGGSINPSAFKWK